MLPHNSSSTATGEKNPVKVKGQSLSPDVVQQASTNSAATTGIIYLHYSTCREFKISDGSTGHGYDRVFADCLDDKLTSVRVEDPYIREPHQIQNLFRFCELLNQKCKNLERITLITSPNIWRGREERNPKACETISQIENWLMESGIAFHVECDPNCHNRQIYFDNGWRVKIDRGLDYFKPPNIWPRGGDADMNLRPCKATTITLFRDETNANADLQSAPFESRFSGEHTIQAVVGRGGYGVVFKAQHKLDERLYAIKRVYVADTEQSRNKVMREVHILAKLDHPHIIRYGDSWLEKPPPGWQQEHDDNLLRELRSRRQQQNGEENNVSPDPEDITQTEIKLLAPGSMALMFEDGRIVMVDTREIDPIGADDMNKKDACSMVDRKLAYLYIKMEFCCGPTLHKWLGQNRLPEQRPISQTLDWFRQLVSAVKYIHDKDLIHRDINPGNIFFGSLSNGVASTLKIGGFGLATYAPASSSSGAYLSIVGTEMYMSPEQSSGKYKNSTDIFSLGLVFLEMVYLFESDKERRSAFGSFRAKKRPKVMNQLDKEMDALISRMTEFEPKKRSTASELDNELKKKKAVRRPPESANEIEVELHAETNDGTDSNAKSETDTSSTHSNKRVRDNETTVVEITAHVDGLELSPGSTTDHPVSGTKIQVTQSSSTSTAKSAPFESKQLDEYTERAMIGRGGFGVVFKARHRIDKEWYAIKQVDPAGTEQSPNKVLREVRFLAELDHSHIIRYYDAWLEKPPPGEELPRMDRNQPCLYIRMELCCGLTLHEWLGQNKLPEQRPVSQTLDWFSQLVSAVKYIHDKKLIHRDIKPGNIFFGSSRDGVASVLKIGDFELATYAATPSSSEVSGDVSANLPIAGTQMYMSPEQLSGDYTNSTDIFSLGLVFLEMVYPFKTNRERQSAFGALRAKRRPRVMDKLDEKMNTLISRMTAFEPKKRPTASELANELKKNKTVKRPPESAKEIGIRLRAETNDDTDSNVKSEASTSSLGAIAAIDGAGSPASKRLKPDPSSEARKSCSNTLVASSFEHSDIGGSSADDGALERVDFTKLLPLELTLKIFGYLYEGDLTRCALVSRKFRDVANHQILWKSLYQEVFEYSLPLLHIGHARFEFREPHDWPQPQSDEFIVVSPWKESFKQLKDGIHVRPGYAPLYSGFGAGGRRLTQCDQLDQTFRLVEARDENVEKLIFLHTGLYILETTATINSDIQIIGASAGPDIASQVTIEGRHDATVVLTEGSQGAYLGWMTVRCAPDPEAAAAVIAAGNPHMGMYRCALQICDDSTALVEHCVIHSSATVGAAVCVKGIAANPKMRHCVVCDCESAGIHVTDAAQGQFEDCEIARNNGPGVYVKNRANPFFRRCHIHDGRYVGIFTSEHGMGYFESCNIHDNRSSGIMVRDAANPTVTRCEVHHGQAFGVYIYNEGRGQFMENRIHSNALPGIGIESHSDPKIMRNKIWGNQNGGVLIQNDGQGVLEENDIFNHLYSGVHIETGSNPKITRNKIWGNQKGGVTIHSNGQGVLEDNEIFDNAMPGVLIKTDGNPMLRYNKIYDGRNVGVYIFDEGRGVLEENEIFDNTIVGILIETDGNPMLKRNKIYNGRGGGVYIYNKGRGVLEDNDIYRNAQAGVLISSESNPTLRRNRVYEGRAAGIEIRSGAMATLESNAIFRNRFGGLCLATGVQPTLRDNKIYDNDDLVEKMIAKGGCLFEIASRTSTPMHDFYCCDTCSTTEEKTICLNCIRTCHAGHDVRLVRCDSFICDCGAGTLKHQCKLSSKQGMSSFVKQSPTTGDSDMALSILDQTESGYAPNKKNWARLRETLKKPEYEALNVSVVSMAGPKRIGKSTVLNFAKRALSHWEQCGQIDRSWLDSEEKLSGFETGDTDDAVTTGILIWPRPFVLTDQSGKKYAVILMDTQGSFDSISTTQDNAAVYAFSTLLASTQIYNVQHTIDDNCLSYLNTFTTFGQHAFPADVEPYQHLTVLVRNWALNPRQPAGFTGGADHLRSHLEVTNGMNEENRVKRTNLRNSFQSISCFLMRGPGDAALAENDMSLISEAFKDDLHELITGSIDRLKSVNGAKLKCRDLADYMNKLLVVFDTTTMPALRDVFVAFKDSANEGALKNAVTEYRSQLLGEAKTVGFDVAHKKLAELARQQMIGKLMDAGSEGERFKEKLVEAVENVLTTLKLEATVHNGNVVKERIRQFSAAIHEIAKTEHVDKAFERCKAESLYGLGNLIQGGPELVEKAEQEIKATMEEERQKIQVNQLLEGEQKLGDIVANYEKEFEALASKDGVDIVDQTLRANALNKLRSVPGTNETLETKLSSALNRIKENVELRFGEHNRAVVDNIFNDFKNTIASVLDAIDPSDPNAAAQVDAKFEERSTETIDALKSKIKGDETQFESAKKKLVALIDDFKRGSKVFKAFQDRVNESALKNAVTEYRSQLLGEAKTVGFDEAHKKLADLARQQMISKLTDAPNEGERFAKELETSLADALNKAKAEVQSRNNELVQERLQKFVMQLQEASQKKHVDHVYAACQRDALKDVEVDIYGGPELVQEAIQLLETKMEEERKKIQANQSRECEQKLDNIVANHECKLEALASKDGVDSADRALRTSALGELRSLPGTNQALETKLDSALNRIKENVELRFGEHNRTAIDGIFNDFENAITSALDAIDPSDPDAAAQVDAVFEKHSTKAINALKPKIKGDEAQFESAKKQLVALIGSFKRGSKAFKASKDSANEGALKNAVDAYRSQLLGEAKTVGLDEAHKKLAELARQQMIGKLIDAEKEGERFAKELEASLAVALDHAKIEVQSLNEKLVQERLQTFVVQLQEASQKEHVDHVYAACKKDALKDAEVDIYGGSELVQEAIQSLETKMEEERQKIQARQLRESEQKLNNIIANHECKLEALASKDGVDIADRELRADALTELRSVPGTNESLETKLDSALNRIKENVELRFKEHNRVVIDDIFNYFKTAIQEAAKREHVDKAFDRCKDEPLHGLGDLIQGGPELVEKAEQEIKEKMEEERQKIQARQLFESEQKLGDIVANYEKEFEALASKDGVGSTDQTLRANALNELRSIPGTDESLETKLGSALNGIKENVESRFREHNRTAVDGIFNDFENIIASVLNPIDPSDPNAAAQVNAEFEERSTEAINALKSNIKGGGEQFESAKEKLVALIGDFKRESKAFKALKSRANESALKNAVTEYRSKLLGEAKIVGFDAAHKKLAELARQQMIGKLMDAKNEGEQFAEKLIETVANVLTMLKLEATAQNGSVVKERIQRFLDAIREAAKTEPVDRAFDRCRAEPLHGLGDLIQGGPDLVEKAEQEIKAKMEEERQKIQANQLRESEQKLDDIIANYECELEILANENGVDDADQTLRANALTELRSVPGTNESLETKLDSALSRIKEHIELRFGEHNRAVVDGIFNDFKNTIASALDAIDPSDSDAAVQVDAKFEERSTEAANALKSNTKGGEAQFKSAKEKLVALIDDFKQGSKVFKALQDRVNEGALKNAVTEYRSQLLGEAKTVGFDVAHKKLAELARQQMISKLMDAGSEDEQFAKKLVEAVEKVLKELKLEATVHNEGVVKERIQRFSAAIQEAAKKKHIDKVFDQCKAELLDGLGDLIQGGPELVKRAEQEIKEKMEEERRNIQENQLRESEQKLNDIVANYECKLESLASKDGVDSADQRLRADALNELRRLPGTDKGLENKLNSKLNEIKENVREKVKLRFFKSAQKLQTTGGKNWYQVPMKEMHADRNKLYKRFDVGKGTVMRPKKVILMVGAAGAGKTTLINGMTNYVFGVRHECDFRLQLVSSETERPETESQTEIISEYVLHAFPDSPVPYTVTFVDTPGFGDTRGIDRDAMLMEMLRALFQDNIQVVDAFCFVVKASDARLTASQTYIFDSVLSIFGKDVLPNIFVMITFADAMAPPIMGALREFNMHNQSCFKFNNCVFSVKQDTATGSDVSRQGPQPANEHAINRMFWVMAYESYKNFFAALGKVESRSVKLTRTVLEKRRELEKEIEILSGHINQGLNELTRMRNLVPVVEELFAREASNKNYSRRVKVPKTRRVHFTNTGTTQRFVTNCMVCSTTCHEHCTIPKDEDKAKCWAMEKSGNCRVCRNHCHWSKHVNRDFVFEDYEDEEEVTVDDMKREYDAAVEGLSAQENVLLGIVQKYEDVQKQVVLSMKKVTDCLNELDRIALRKNLLTTVDYVDELIRATQQEKKPGYESRLAHLNKARERAELISKIKKEGFDSSAYDDPKLEAILKDARQNKKTDTEKMGIRKRILELCKKIIEES